MPKFYDQAPAEICDVVAMLLKRDRPELHSAGVRIDVLTLSDDDDETGGVLKLGGYTCAAIVRITSAKERAAGRGDAEIVIAYEWWKKRTERQQEALLFHELWHLKLKTRDGIPQFDSNERPFLKMRLHDHNFGWFNEVAARYGEDSYEVEQANAFKAKSGQMHFGWMEAPAKAKASAHA